MSHRKVTVFPRLFVSRTFCHINCLLIILFCLFKLILALIYLSQFESHFSFFNCVTRGMAHIKKFLGISFCRCVIGSHASRLEH